MSLKRAVLGIAILLLAVPAAVSAAVVDNTGTDGQLITGSKLVTAVGGSDTPGAISVRFADTLTPLFYPYYDNDGVDAYEAPGMFALHEDGVPYSSYQANLVQTSAPVVAGDGSTTTPWNVTSGFATPDLGIVQQVRHVDASRSLRLTWRVTNTSYVPVKFNAFWSTDLYVSGSDEGTGALLAGPPRTLQGVAIDGTKVGLIEVTPWSHYFEGHYEIATNPWYYGWAQFHDTINPSSVDNGFGVQWNRTLAAHASSTFVLGFGAAEPGGNPLPAVAPDITQSPVSGPSHSATFAFDRHAGDTATVEFECSIDGGPFDLCTSPATFTGLGVGNHVFRVHGINKDGNSGPAAPARWTVTHARRHVASPDLGLDPVSVAGHSLEVRCALPTGTMDRCSVTLVTPSGVVVGRGVRVFHGAHGHGKVHVVLTAKGRALAANPGGVKVRATAVITPNGGGKNVIAKQTVHVVSPHVAVTPGSLQFESGSAVLLPSGRSYLLGLVSQLAGAKQVVATGYTDNLGSAAANYRLGLARANAVCAFLSSRAHVACRAASYGESHPRATNTTAAGRALNRRVELQLTY